jgi:hypothetical protein
MKAYVNGVYKGSKDNSTGDVPVYNSALHLGILNAGYQVNGVDCCWRGRLDEARVSSKARSADWLWTEYNNVKNHTSFQSYHPHANGTIILIH